MRARTTTFGTITERAKTTATTTGKATAKAAKTGTTKAARTSAKAAQGSPWKIGMPGTMTTPGKTGTSGRKGTFGKAGKTGKSRRTSTKTIIAAGCGVIVIGAGIAALPATRRAARTFANKRRQRFVSPVGLDELTGLPNRAEGERMLGAALDRARARGRRVALLYVDLDDFKLCNDTYGSDAGDHVLQVTAARMQAQLRSGDTVCRLGGDDFIVIMESAGPDHMVTRVAERISDAVAQPMTFEGETILIGCSIGVAVAVNGDAEVDELIAHGDSAVDRARAAGRHVVQY